MAKAYLSTWIMPGTRVNGSTISKMVTDRKRGQMEQFTQEITEMDLKMAKENSTGLMEAPIKENFKITTYMG